MKDEQLLISARIKDMCGQALKYHMPAHTSFYSPGDLASLHSKIQTNPLLKVMSWGGYSNAERKLVLAYPDFYDLSDCESLNNAAEISILRFHNTAGRQLSHRDYLGALMSLGIDRQKIGDILVCDDEALVFADDKISEYIVNDIDKISNCRVTVSVSKQIDEEVFEKFSPKFVEKDLIVSSMRIDCIVSEAYGLSRSESLSFVKNEKVRINYIMCDKPDSCISEGDLISVTGKGRFVVSEIVGNTKKNNIILKVSFFV